MKELALLNPENVSAEEAAAYPVREAARAVVFDSEGKIALLHVSNKKYYKLPGGGLDDDTDKVVALKRECREEIGCEIEVIGEVGMLTEYRKFSSLRQISYCYAARVLGEKEMPDFTESEMREGFKEIWVTYDEAEQALEDSKPTDQESQEYIVPRDKILLEAAKGFVGT